MLLSIIIPLYNKANFIEKTIESITSQYLEDYEIIVVNDGSTDNSRTIVENINDNHISVVSQKNSGVSCARNTGLFHAKGDWILFLDADDLLMDNSLKQLVDAIDKHKDSNLISGYYTTKYSDEKEIVSSKLTNEEYLENPGKLMWKRCWEMRLGSFIVKKSVIEKSGFFPEYMNKGEDVIFVHNLIRNSRIFYIPVNVMTYRRDIGSLSYKKVPIEKCFSWNVSCSTEDKYLNLVCGNTVAKCLILQLIHFDFSNFKKMLIKHKNELFTIVRSLVRI